jgi:alkylresorcinol/alkylpyrone synthase
MKIAAVGSAFPEHYYDQQTITGMLRQLWQGERAVADRIESLHHNVGVEGRHLSMPLEDYARLESFGQSNDVWIQTALQIGEEAVREALESADLRPEDVDAIIFSTVTGLASPSIDARLANRMGFRPDIKRMPLFGLGCVAGAAAVARAHDYLKGHRTASWSCSRSNSAPLPCSWAIARWPI